MHPTSSPRDFVQCATLRRFASSRGGALPSHFDGLLGSQRAAAIPPGEWGRLVAQGAARRRRTLPRHPPRSDVQRRTGSHRNALYSTRGSSAPQLSCRCAAKEDPSGHVMRWLSGSARSPDLRSRVHIRLAPPPPPPPPVICQCTPNAGDSWTPRRRCKTPAQHRSATGRLSGSRAFADGT